MLEVVSIDDRDFLAVVDKLDEFLLTFPPFSLVLVSLGEWLLSPELLLELFPPADDDGVLLLSSVTFTESSLLPFSCDLLSLGLEVGVVVRAGGALVEPGVALAEPGVVDLEEALVEEWVGVVVDLLDAALEEVP